LWCGNPGPFVESGATIIDVASRANIEVNAAIPNPTPVRVKNVRRLSELVIELVIELG
jgi:hypothetical protein